MLRVFGRKRVRQAAATAEDAAIRILGHHCCSCVNFKCEAGCEPDQDWLRWWLSEVGCGDPFVTLALDCQDWKKKEAAKEARPVSLAYSGRKGP
jgi:hypothetical protein